MEEVFARWQQGDEKALGELITLVHERFRQRAVKILAGGNALVGATEVVNEAVLRILQNLKREQTPTLKHFFAFAAEHIRGAFLDLGRQYAKNRGPGQGEDGNAGSSGPQPGDPSQSTDDPAKLAEWTEIHYLAAHLPDKEREVFDLHWYNGLTHAEAAQLLGVSERTVKARWASARRKLAHAWQGQDAASEHLSTKPRSPKS
jgi:RNA polymerase sigma-70 factor (ECF subfamily)